VVAVTLKPPPHEVTHWTGRAMAKAAGIAVFSVQKIWSEHELAPHRWRQFKLSNDPVFGRNMQRHRHQEFIRFLNGLENDIPADKTVHVILDNYATHKYENVRKWLARHPRWTCHFTPTLCSWLNAVEGFFDKLTRRRLKHGVFHSLVNLQAAINRFIKEHNQTPKPFIWKADPNEIIAAVKRRVQTLESIY
jgi:transposase